MCSLNVDIPSTVAVLWLHNGSIAMTTTPNEVIQSGNTVRLLLENLQLSDAGVYQCVFNDTFNDWTLRRNISLVITSMFIY